MVEVYEGEAEYRVVIDDTFVVTGVNGFNTIYNASGIPVEEDYVLPYTEVAYGPGQSEVVVDISQLSVWPTPFRLEIDCDEPVTVYADVVTPYASVEEIALAGKIDMDDEYAVNYHPYNEVREMESIARHVIDSYTGCNFGRRYIRWVLDGTDNNQLYSDDQVSRIDLVLHEDEPIYSSLEGDYVVSPSGHAIQVFDSDGEAYGFPEKYDYPVVGIFGPRHVPQDIRLCAKQLAVSYLCGDASQKQNYIDQVKFGESQTRTNRLAFVGTGLRTVDIMLDKYKFHSYRVL